MKLVKILNFQLVVEDELLLLTPFKTLYKKDKSKDKNKFMEFLTILYYVWDPRSDYSYIVNEKERLKEVCITNGFDEPTFNDTQKECIELYKKLTTTITQELLNSTKVAIAKVRDFLENVDLYAEDEKGKPKYTINSITTALKQVPELAKNVTETEKIVTRELEESGRARGGNNKTLMDDGVLIG